MYISCFNNVFEKDKNVGDFEFKKINNKKIRFDKNDQFNHKTSYV